MPAITRVGFGGPMAAYLPFAPKASGVLAEVVRLTGAAVANPALAAVAVSTAALEDAAIASPSLTTITLTQ